VVEDEPNIGNIIAFKLEREGHQVTRRESAGDVAAAAADVNPHIILLDSSLPDGDAFSLLRHLRQSYPVIMLTEFRDAAGAERAKREGATATVEKPFKPTVLARLVAQFTPQPTS
jgi:DNA-binding response OmpR family regulator